jgi:alkylation response protein AidB-like acyl-CoA dehydrogenase
VDFAFSDEQLMLRAAAREFADERYPTERVATIADSPDGFDRSEWRTLAELGWTGISVPESLGGAGLGFLEELIVVEELARGPYPGPFFSTVVLGLHALAAGGADELVAGVASGERTATVAWAGTDGRFDTDPVPKVDWEGDRLTATKLFVPDLRVSDLLVIVGGTPDGPGVWVVERDADGVAWRELPTVDPTRRMGEVVLQEVAADRLRTEGGGFPTGLRDRALAALAVEAVGLGSRALELGIGHARERVQFGRPIGAFQAVSHQLAQAFLEIETARSLAYWAGWAVSEGVPEAPTAAAAAKARAAEAAIRASERAIQVHGGMGFTWDAPLHRLYKRALAINAFMGTGDELRARVAASLLDRG